MSGSNEKEGTAEQSVLPAGSSSVLVCAACAISHGHMGPARSCPYSQGPCFLALICPCCLLQPSGLPQECQLLPSPAARAAGSAS